jgi:hypothetical protein
MLLTALAAPALAQLPPGVINDGTDPARPTNYATLSFERRGLPDNDGESSLFAEVNLPFGDGLSTAMLRLPLVGVDSAGNGLGPGDIALKLSRVLPTDANGAIILGGKIEFDTASRPERGAGQSVAAASMIIERVLPGGTIIAPTVTHSLGISGRAARVNISRFNLYVVPALAIDALYLTIDPAFTRDWGEEASYGEFVATLGYRFASWGKADVQAFVRPALGVGQARSFVASIELGLQLLNF